MRKTKKNNINYTQNSINFEKNRSPCKSNINIYKGQSLISKTTEGKDTFFKSFLGKNKKEECKPKRLGLKNESKSNEKNRIENNKYKINEEKKENETKKNNNKNENKKILLNKLTDLQKKEIMLNFKKKINRNKEKYFKENVQKKIELLHATGCNLDEIFNNNLYNIIIGDKEKNKNKTNLHNKRHFLKDIIINTNEIKNRASNLRHNTYNHKGMLFTSYSNINVLSNNKKIKTPLRAIKSKINTFEFINKIKKRISPEKKIIFHTNINNNKNIDFENESNFKQNNFKNIIVNYIKIKRKERKDNEIKKKEKINKENLKKYENFIKLQENIKDSMLKKNELEEEKDEGKKIQIFDNTNKSSVFGEQEYYINCYEAQRIYNINDINLKKNNYTNLKNQLSKSIEYHINLNKIRNKNNNIHSKTNTNNIDINDFDLIEKKLRKSNELFNKLHINNLLRKQKVKNKSIDNKYKSLIERIINTLKKIIKHKYFQLFKYNINSISFFVKTIIKVIKYFPFSLLKQYNKTKNIIKLKKTIFKVFIQKHLNNIRSFTNNIKFQNSLNTIIKNYIKKYFNIFINHLKNVTQHKSVNYLILNEDPKEKINNIKNNKDILNDNNDGDIDKKNENNHHNILSNNEVPSIKQLLLNSENTDNTSMLLNKDTNIKNYTFNGNNLIIKNENRNNNKNNSNNNNIKNESSSNESIQIIIGNESYDSKENSLEKNKEIKKKEDTGDNKIFLNNAFFHNKEIFKNLRYEDDDDFFFNEDSNEENNFDKNNKINGEEEHTNNDKHNNDNEIEKYFKNIPIEVKNNIEKELTEEIIKELLDIEIKNKDKIITKKTPIIQFENKQKEIISNNKNNTINSNNNSQLDSSLDNSNISLLKKSIGEIKEGKKLNKYSEKKFPIFLKMIENNIKKNYIDIINNLKEPLVIDEEKYINKIGNFFNDKNIINNNILEYNNEMDDNEIQKNSFLLNFNIPYTNKNIVHKKFIDENILKEFNTKNELMNNKSNEDTNNISKYDVCLNKCVYDSANEIIEKRRMYGDIGKPLIWSSRSQIIRYTFDNSDYSKKIFIKDIKNELKDLINKKIGLIPENYDYMSLEHLISDREKKFIQNIKNDLDENSEEDNNLDLIFTTFLINISKLIMDQLLEEVIHTLNLVEQSRKNPSKFGAKSIYSYDNEEVPIIYLGDKNDYDGDNFIFH